MSKDDNSKINKRKITGTASLLKQSRILNKVIDEHGEKRAMFAFALSLSEHSNIDYQPDDGKKVATAINIMMHTDLSLEPTADFLKKSQESLNQTLLNLDEKNNELVKDYLTKND